MNNSGIYKMQSIIKPERIYIGSATNIQQRYWEHSSLLNLNKHPNKKLQFHFNKYGEEDLTFTIIDPCFPEFLIIREQYYIDTLKPWFNICPIAGNRLGTKHSEETIEQMRMSRTGELNHFFGKYHSKETRQKMSDAAKGNKNCLGHKQSEEHKKKIGEIHKDKKLSEETKKKISDTQTGRKRGTYKKSILI